MFQQLIESSRRRIDFVSLEGYAVSLVAHVLLVGLVAYRSTPMLRPDTVPESFKWAEFLLPREKSAGSPEVREHVTYVAAPAVSAQGQLTTDAPSEPSTIPIVKAPGTGKDTDAQEASAPLPAEELPGDTVLTVLEVDSAASRYEDSAAPPYPPDLLKKKIEGSVAVQYVVDTTGRADPESVVILATTHPLFAESVKKTLPLMRFRPALWGSQRVRQLVQQSFSFRIDTTLLAPSGRKP